MGVVGFMSVSLARDWRVGQGAGRLAGHSRASRSASLRSYARLSWRACRDENWRTHRGVSAGGAVASLRTLPLYAVRLTGENAAA